MTKTKPQPTHSLLVVMPKALNARLDALVRAKLSKRELIRRAISDYLDKMENQK